MRDTRVPGTIDATVNDGAATLTGRADWQYQRDEAASPPANVRGVFGVKIQIVLNTPTGSPVDIEPPSRRRLGATPGSTR
jgi:osmotically-inducible protein OsmY